MIKSSAASVADLKSVGEELAASREAWALAMAEVQTFSRLVAIGSFQAAELCRVAAVAHIEASLDAISRAHRKVQAGQGL